MTTSESTEPVAVRDEDLRPLLISWAISLTAAAVWLALVYLSPPARKAPVETAARPTEPALDFEPGRHVTATAPRIRERDVNREAGQSLVQTRGPVVDVAAAFATTVAKKVTNDVASLIDKVEAVSAKTATVLTGEKAVLSTGNGRTTPGIARLGDNAGGRSGSSFGAVGQTQGGGVRRAEVRVQPLAVVAAPAPRGGSVDPIAAGDFVRERAAQLQYCYSRVKPTGENDLAGVVTLRLTLGASGVVKDAEIVRRTWSGPAAAEMEACLVATARRWRVPSGSDGATLTLPISFTRAR